uniref:G-protein coupled receptors family 2 profile 2 domain-containing protein n=1 Tax=Clastoptera arizonana TaxID=38151 RepID=A0A1B6DQS8_9HEMI
MAKRIHKKPRKRSNKHWITISAVLLFTIVLCIFVFYYFVIERERTHAAVCEHNDSLAIESAVLQKDGSYKDKDGVVYPVGYHFREDGVLRGCTCALRPCVRKCCREDEEINENNTCQETKRESLVLSISQVYRMVKSAPSLVNTSRGHFSFLYGDVCTFGKFMLQDEDVYYLMEDGTVWFLNKFYTTADYCLDTFVNSSTILTLMCFPDQEPSSLSTYRLYSIGLFISLPFLFLTFLTYAVLPELQNLHGKNLMCHVVCLFIAYMLLGVLQLAGDNIWHSCCTSFAFIIQFSFLASFFWLNIMCFDIWWVFSGLRPLRGSVKEREHKKFIIYSIYAWGCPLIIFIITLVMQTVKEIPDTFIKPEFGLNKCWFSTEKATFIYFYLPMGVVVILNIIMFATTALRLVAHTKETDNMLNKNGESQRHNENERQRFNLYLKLFIVMGINWVTEIVSWYLGGPKYLWYITDLTNTLQGVLIFLIFVWKRRILRLLNQKICPNIELVSNTTSSTRSKVSPSRTTSSSLKQPSSNVINFSPDAVALKKLPISDDSDNIA